ncbi:hypothetical protein BDA96_10G006600 [Sorghum bicolor]|jgi:hypothetical protein|uniref:TF-B3 domain-containing protein n=2 Tax=Sorghum bicolor TaxID=4558 RepID=A0A921Q0V1_SORBI|nr:B3 domain-containing protein Os06g0107800 [Sorghum bicolor]KAG0512360.1 hypothetical protein BDA96_10G006600 [Sorghum bicolor]KXG19111.2 hypothetical protein SORBI_3010G006000 [Sorghum bicolor]|eukprot:XP_002437686.1 B3 domain-containing protein Os06g0107800 [Sorghum bicolor]
MALTLAPELESTAAGSNYSHSSDSGSGRREHMFEKVVTQSDVGKLNRLVVPKQFAERHLPLRGAAARSRGTVLCFHDARSGGTSPAAWRFRYSYWSSSQSYVMTKGWNRYVRDKRLVAGDTVTFCRDGARLFIDCRHRQRRSSRRTGEQGAAVPHAVVVPAAMLAALPPVTLRHQQPQGLVVFSGQHQQQADQDAVVVEDEEEEEEAQRQRGRWLRLFGVNLLELRTEAPVLLDLQLI